jgi:hypothetical protein
MSKRFIVGVVGLALLSGCGATHYKVHDPTTGRDYYTTKLEQKKSGAATLTDGRTGKTINLQNSEIEKITKEQYQQGIHTPPPAPAPEPAPNPFK